MSELASDWLGAREADVPVLLRAPLRDVVAGAEAVSPAILLESACSSLKQAFEMGPERAAAPHLLVADALVTWACELAATEEGALEELAARTFQQLAVLLGESGE
jgi:hypothetical protein